MPRIVVATGFSPTGLEQYGRRMVNTFKRHWPDDVRLVAYTERFHANIDVEQILLDDAPGCAEFIREQAANLFAHGRRERSGWRNKEKRARYSFRFDAVKFCRMAFFARDAGRRFFDYDYVVWLDGDTFTFRDVPANFIPSICPLPAAAAYLGRDNTHSETGFVAFRMPAATPLMEGWGRMYESCEVFSLPEWHSAYVFDHVRRQYEADGMECINITPGGSGHVWLQSPLVEYMDHLKGAGRKARGWSTGAIRAKAQALRNGP